MGPNSKRRTSSTEPPCLTFWAPFEGNRLSFHFFRTLHLVCSFATCGDPHQFYSWPLASGLPFLQVAKIVWQVTHTHTINYIYQSTKLVLNSLFVHLLNIGIRPTPHPCTNEHGLRIVNIHHMSMSTHWHPFDLFIAPPYLKEWELT